MLLLTYWRPHAHPGMARDRIRHTADVLTFRSLHNIYHIHDSRLKEKMQCMCWKLAPITIAHKLVSHLIYYIYSPSDIYIAIQGIASRSTSFLSVLCPFSQIICSRFYYENLSYSVVFVVYIVCSDTKLWWNVILIRLKHKKWEHKMQPHALNELKCQPSSLARLQPQVQDRNIPRMTTSPTTWYINHKFITWKNIYKPYIELITQIFYNPKFKSLHYIKFSKLPSSTLSKTRV